MQFSFIQYYIIVVGMAGGFRWSVLKNYDEIAFLHKQVCYYFMFIFLTDTT